MNKLHRICISGASGRMGQQLLQAVDAADDCQLVSAISQFAVQPPQDALAFIGKTSGIVPTTDFASAIEPAEFLIDFSQPQASLLFLEQCRRAKVKMVIGTTGFTAEQKQQIQQAAQEIAIVMAPNMSVGVNVTLKLLELASKALADSCDIEIIEAHHKHKVDAPSGTALRMGEVIAATQNKALAQLAVYSREGIIGERQTGSIGFSTIRGGDIVGDHTVLFAGSGERIEISHKASDRKIYAQGSLRAVRFLQQQTCGLFDMFDVLGLNQKP